MKTATLVSSFAAAAGIALASSVFAPAQAAVLGGDGECANAQFTYIDCAGFYDSTEYQAGNNLGAGGISTEDIASLFNVDSVTLASAEFIKDAGTSGTVTNSGYSGFGIIAIKAGTSFSLYSIADLSNFSWDTLGVQPVGRQGNTPGLSHLSIYTANNTADVPEPLTILGTGLALGFGGAFKKQQDKKKQKDSTKA